MSFSNPQRQVLGGEPEANLGRGVLVGIAAAVVGAAAWGIFTAVTNYQVGIIALGIGWLVGYAMVRYGNSFGTPAAVAAGVIAFVGVLVGHVASVYIAAVREGFPLDVVMDLVGPVEVITNGELTEPISWLFFVLAPFAAVRLVMAAQPQAAPIYAPPAHGGAALPSYGAPAPGSYGAPVTPPAGGYYVGPTPPATPAAAPTWPPSNVGSDFPPPPSPTESQQ